MKKYSIIFAISAAFFIFAQGAWAQGRPWTDHRAPFDFWFGTPGESMNHFDTHQQTKLAKNGELFGFFYIEFTGYYNEEGIPEARHCDESTLPENCEVGWILRGIPGEAELLYHNMEHPVWLVEREHIPQPGSYTHFHWLGNTMPAEDDIAEGYFIQLEAVRSFVFLHSGDKLPVRPGIDNATHVNIVGSRPPDMPGMPH